MYHQTKSLCLNLAFFSLLSIQGLVAQENQPASVDVKNHPITKAMAKAYQTNPDLHKAIRTQYATAEQVPNALRGWRPNLGVNLVGSKNKTITEGTNEGLTNIGTLQKVGIDSKTNSTQSQAGLVLSQNLYNGWQTTHSISAAENTVLAGEAAVLAKEEDVLTKAAQAYLELWQANQNLEFRITSEKFAKRSYDEIKAQEEVGEKTITDVAETETRLATATAQRVSAEASLDAARATYLQVIGDTAPEELTTPYDVPEVIMLPSNMAELQKESLDKNPFLLQAFFNEKAAEQSVYATEGTILPTLDFEASGNRNFRQDGTPKNASRVHSRSNDGTVRLTMRIPLYQSGGEWSAIRKSNQDRYAARNEWRIQKRVVEQSVKALWSNWKAAAVNVKQFELAVKAAEVTLEGKRQEYLVGEVTLTDMLQAESNLVQNQTNLVEAKKSYYLNSYQILALYGNLIPETLYLDVNRYDLKGYADQVRGQFIGTGDLRENLDVREE